MGEGPAVAIPRDKASLVGIVDALRAAWQIVSLWYRGPTSLIFLGTSCNLLPRRINTLSQLESLSKAQKLLLLVLLPCSLLHILIGETGYLPGRLEASRVSVWIYITMNILNSLPLSTLV